MPVLNHQRPFAADVKSGKKRQTIRGRFRIGDTLYQYVDQHKNLGIHTCRMAVDIEFEEVGVGVGVYLGEGSVNRLGVDEVLSLAIADGFRSTEEMMAWVETTYGLPFCGQLIMW